MKSFMNKIHKNYNTIIIPIHNEMEVFILLPSQSHTQRKV